jgi:hypothetical protein
MAENLFCDASEHHAANARSPVRAHDDEIGEP